MATRDANKLQNRRLLVLGGTSGIGFSVAEAALKSGADVIVSSSNEAKLCKAVERLHSATAAEGVESTVPVSGLRCDLGDAATLEKNLGEMLEMATEGRTRLLDHVVFTAGGAIKIVRIPDITVEAIQEANLVRLVAPVMVAKLLPRYINHSVSSSFTLTSGVAARRPPPGWAAMTSVGAAVEGLARGLAVDLKPVRVNCVLPGAVHTELFSDIPQDRLPAVLDKFKQDSLTNTVGTPEELSEAYMYCMKNTFATGSSIVADGGRLLA